MMLALVMAQWEESHACQQSRDEQPGRYTNDDAVKSIVRITCNANISSWGTKSAIGERGGGGISVLCPWPTEGNLETMGAWTSSWANWTKGLVMLWLARDGEAMLGLWDGWNILTSSPHRIVREPGATVLSSHMCISSALRNIRPIILSVI